MSVSGTYQDQAGRYKNKVFQVEPFGVEQVSENERHGHPVQLFSLWLGANLTIADFALGFLPVHLGLSWPILIGSILIGNLLGAFLLALATVMGPRYGLPQLMIGRFSFGRIGGYLPALLNWIGTVGWFTVNNILGAFGLRVLVPQLFFLWATVLLVVAQGILAIYGHNLIHAFERVMAVVLGILFLIASFLTGSQGGALQQYHGVANHPYALAFIVVAAAFSYVASWSPYASDYSRYLKKETSLQKMFWCTFWGAFLACTWLELLGATVAVLAGPHSGNAIQSLHVVTGNWGDLMVIAVILGGIASNALNLYSNALSAGALDIRVNRTTLTLIAMLVGVVLSLAGAGRFESFYEDFLLSLGYWVTPWIAILFAEFFLFRGREGTDGVQEPPVLKKSGLFAFLIRLLVSIPFMSSTLYTGPIAKSLNGADLSFYVGFVVAGVVYLVFRGNRQTSM